MSQDDAVPRGTRAILAYKAARGACDLAGLGVLLTLIRLGRADAVERGARYMQDHFVGAWSNCLAEALFAASDPRYLRWACLALGADFMLNLTEWWCLRRRTSWGRWFVVATSGSLLPFEIWELWRGLSAGRVVIFVMNLLVVLYLSFWTALPEAGTAGQKT